MPPAFADLKTRLAARSPLQIVVPGVMETAVSLILTPGAQGLDALFIRRAQREGDPWSGQIGLPGGRREITDRDRLHTAVRETAEEVGIELEPSSLLGALDDLHPRTGAQSSLVIRPFVFGYEQRPSAGLSSEVAEVLWLPLSRLADNAGVGEIDLGGKKATVDCFKLDGVVVWGLTHRIVSGLLPFLT